MSGGVGGGVGGGKDVEASTPLLGKSTVQAPKFSKKADWATGVPKADWATGVPKAVPTVRSASKPVVGKSVERAQYRSHRVVERDEEWTGRLSIHCECTTFNLQEIFNYFRERPPYIARWLRQDVVHLRKLRSEVDLIEDAVWWSGVEDPFAGAAEMFLFSYGVLSTWGLSEGGEWELRETLKQFQLTDFDTPEEEELFAFAYKPAEQYTDQQLVITEDVIYLLESLGTGEELIRAKLAVSYGMAQSARLATFEASVDSIFERVGNLPVVMAQTGQLKLTDHHILMLSGELLAYSAYINLQTDVLDTPDWFWDNETYEPVYEKVARYLKVRHRVDIVNQRLGVLGDMYSLFRDERHIHYGHRLEWIVIWLIVAEIVLDLLELAALFLMGI